MLIYQVGLLILNIFYNFINYDWLDNLICTMLDKKPGLASIISSGGLNVNEDRARLVRYLATNLAVLQARRPMTKAIGLLIINTGNILQDVVKDERKTRFWMEQYINYKDHGRFKVSEENSVSFPKGQNPFEDIVKMGDTKGNNFLPDFNFFKDLFSPVEHSIPLDTLQDIHIIIIIGLFVLILCVVLLLIYFFINLLILFNKDYLLNRIKNKYALLYIKYVIFRTRIDIFVIGLLIIGTLCFVLYYLHYLIIHPIKFST